MIGHFIEFVKDVATKAAVFISASFIGWIFRGTLETSRSRHVSMSMFKKGTRQMHEQMCQGGFRPDLSIEIGQNGSVVAAFVLGPFPGKDPQRLPFNVEKFQDGTGCLRRRIPVEEHMISKEFFKKYRNIVVFDFEIVSGDTMSSVLDYLKDHGVNRDCVKIASFFHNPKPEGRLIPDYTYSPSRIRKVCPWRCWLSDESVDEQAIMPALANAKESRHS